MDKFINILCIYMFFEKMKKLYKFIAVVLLVNVLFFKTYTSTSANSPKDIQNHKYMESIQYLYDHWVVQWYPDGNFRPNREINRWEIMKIILESSIWPDLWELNNCFEDVKDERFAKYVCYAKSQNMVKWYDDWKFRPYQYVSFAEALKMWIEWFSKKTESVSNWEPWYQGYLNFVHNNNIFSKYEIFPYKNMTRWEMAYFIHQFMLEKGWKVSFGNQRKSWSSWCGKEPPATPIKSSVVNWVVRNYITVIWNRYDKNKPTKLILAFHGRTNSNEMVRSYYWIEKATNWNAIIIYPSGLPENSSPRNRSNPGDKKSNLRDFALFDQILKDFEENYCIDKDQIFVVWHSLWAWFTNSLSCARGDKIRAIWSVWWWTTINECSGPVAWIIMQHPDDNLSPYREWVVARDQMLKQNFCWPETVPFWPAPLNCVKYTNCLSDAPVVWCPHSDSTDNRWKYYPHTWPDNAWSEIIKFFESL